MNIKIGSGEWLKREPELSSFERVNLWIQEHPTVSKILKIAGLMFGLGLLASLPLVASLGMGLAVSVAIAGIAVILASTVLSVRCPSAAPLLDGSHEINPVEEKNEDAKQEAELSIGSSSEESPAVEEKAEDILKRVASSLDSNREGRLIEEENEGIMLRVASNHGSKASLIEEVSLMPKVTPPLDNGEKERSVEQEKEEAPTVFSSPVECNVVERTVLPIAVLWSKLKNRTVDELRNLVYLSKIDLQDRCRFGDVRCPKETAVSAKGRYLHANKVGEGLTERNFIASQAPLKEDYEAFWGMIFEQRAVIFDLTTAKERKSGGVTDYYPNQLNEIIKYGSFSVKLTKINESIYTYEVESAQVKVEIKRCHCTEWKDCSAVALGTLIQLVQEIKNFAPNPEQITIPNSEQIIWIHCRAGVGRTGTLITACILEEKIKSGEINQENLDDALLDMIIQLRRQRGRHFVTEREQLDLLRQYANFLLSNGES